MTPFDTPPGDGPDRLSSLRAALAPVDPQVIETWLTTCACWSRSTLRSAVREFLALGPMQPSRQPGASIGTIVRRLQHTNAKE